MDIILDYAFENLPGTAVFSVYGEDAAVGWIYHCNRGLIDDHRPAGLVSTFEVVTCTLMGDVNDDGELDGLDIAAYVRVKLGSPGPDDNPLCADYGGTLEEDTALFLADLLAM